MDNVIQSGNNVEFEVLFNARNADVSKLCCQVNGEGGYLEFDVENASGITNGEISTTIQTKKNTPGNQYELKIVLIDNEGNVSEHITVIVTIIPDKNADHGVSNCISGNNPPNLTGTWDLTYTIIEVPAIVEDMLLGTVINEHIEITQSGTQITFI